MKPSRFARRCSMEALEDRRVMAGDVLAGILAGNLVIAGDNSSNAITVTAGATSGQVVVTGVNDAGGVATRVNGSSNGAITLNGFNGRIDFLMNGGDDNVSLDGLTSKGTVLDLGRGNDVFSLTNYTVKGDLTVKGSDGDENGAVTDFNVSGLFTVDLGAGTNKLDARRGAVGRDGKFVSGSGDDNIGVLSVAFTGNISASLGDGQNLFFATNVNANRAEVYGGKIKDTIQVEVSAINWLTVDAGQGDNQINLFAPKVFRDLRVTAGSGNDTLIADEGGVDGNVTIDLGDGNNIHRFALDTKGDVSLRGGRGADTVTLEGQFSNTPIVYRSLKVGLGDGANSLTATQISTRGRAEVRGGKNDDTINWTTGAFDSFFADLGAGMNAFNLSSGTISRGLELRGGNGSDSGQISGSTISGSTLVCLGDGENGYFTLQQSTFNGDVTYQGGRGADFLVLYNIHALRALKASFGDGANNTSVLGITIDGRADFIGGTGVDNFEIVSLTAATLNVAMGRGNDTLKLGLSTTTQSTRIDGEDGQDTYLVADVGANNFASFVQRSFETLGTFHPA